MFFLVVADESVDYHVINNLERNICTNYID